MKEHLISQLQQAPQGSQKLNAQIAKLLKVRKPAPHYTTSIDAALLLVPQGAAWHIMTDYGDLCRAKIGPRNNPSASIYRDEDRPLFIVADAATPALALCIAALQAAGEDTPHG